MVSSLVSSLAILRTEADHPPPDSRDETVDLDAKFSPNLLNSAIFLLSTSQQVSTFAVNFIGRPFREDISENTFLKYGLLGASGVAVAGAIDFAPEFSKWLQIVEMSVRAAACSDLTRRTVLTRIDDRSGTSGRACARPCSSTLSVPGSSTRC